MCTIYNAQGARFIYSINNDDDDFDDNANQRDFYSAYLAHKLGAQGALL